MAASIFHPGDGFVPERNVRDFARLVKYFQSPTKTHHGVLIPLVGTRRSGKTWALRALEAALAAMPPRWVDLRAEDHRRELYLVDEERTHWLIDEPGECLVRDPEYFVTCCKRIDQAGGRVLVAMTPGEWEILHRVAGSETLVALKDLRYLEPLDDQQAKTMARRAGAWATTLCKNLPVACKRNPFLLELILSEAERNPKLRSDLSALQAAVIRTANDPPHQYAESVFGNGLSAAQRACLKETVRGQPLKEPEPRGLLGQCGLLSDDTSVEEIADPVLRDYLPPPLRIHHLSDLHESGGQASTGVDVKTKGASGARFKEALGDVALREAYHQHIKTLKAQGPNVLIVSGDMTFRGKKEGMTAIREWLDEIRDDLTEHPLLRKGEERILIVGGNHDVQRESPDERHTCFAEVFDGLPRPRLEEPAGERPVACARYLDMSLDILLLGSAELGGEMLDDERTETIESLVNDVADAAGKAVDEIPKEHIDPGLVHYLDLEAVKRHPWENKVRIAVLHHPLSPMPQTEVAAFAGTLNAGQVKAMLIDNRFCLALHGHLHAGWFGTESWPHQKEGWALRIAAAPTLCSDATFENNGYNEIEIAREGTDRYEVTVRRIKHSGNQWEQDGKSLGPFEPGKPG